MSTDFPGHPRGRGDTITMGPVDITEDLTEAQLAEVAFSEEVVVYWDHKGERTFGIIVGYEDPRSHNARGLFTIDPVLPGPDADRAEEWRETGETPVRLRRNQFQVFGPANRDPGDRQVDTDSGWWGVLPGTGRTQRTQTPTMVATEVLQHIDGFDAQMTPFLCAVIDLIAEEQIDTGLPAFEVRLDADVDDKSAELPRKYRILVRPSMQPMLHDEIEKVLTIASRYELAVWHSNAGLEIHRQGEAPA